MGPGVAPGVGSQGWGLGAPPAGATVATGIRGGTRAEVQAGIAEEPRLGGTTATVGSGVRPDVRPGPQQIGSGDNLNGS